MIAKTKEMGDNNGSSIKIFHTFISWSMQIIPV